MLIIMAKEGRTVCGPSCPFYTKAASVACFGGNKESCCRMIMQPYFVDCNEYDVTTLAVHKVKDENAAKTLRLLADQPIDKQRKLYKSRRTPRSLMSDGRNINRH